MTKLEERRDEIPLTREAMNRVARSVEYLARELTLAIKRIERLEQANPAPKENA